MKTKGITMTMPPSSSSVQAATLPGAMGRLRDHRLFNRRICSSEIASRIRNNTTVCVAA